MTVHPLLFDLAPSKPTTRDVANQVRSMVPTDGLPDAAHLADGASYQEVTCRSALNPVKGMPFDWTLNPYRGCTHGCHYCFARRYHAQFELGTGDEFSSVILVKKNFVDVLQQRARSPVVETEYVAFGTATDVYQPIEGHYKITRRSLEALALSRARRSASSPKGPMVVRDKDVLLELTRRAGCTVYVSVPTVDEDAWRILEPGTAHPLQRLRAVRELNDAGIRAGVLINPIVPGLTSQPAKLERTIKAIADHGAAFMGTNLLYLKEGTRAALHGLSRKALSGSLDEVSASLCGRLRSSGVCEGSARNREAAAEQVRRVEAGRRRQDNARRDSDSPGDEQKTFDWTD